VPRLLHYSDVENVFDTPERAARLAGRIDAVAGPDALVVGTGDTIAPGVLSLVSRGRQAVDFHAATGAALETFGNHEFDHGPDELRAIVAESPAQWLTANVRDEAGEPFGRAEGVTATAVREVDGARIGFLGVTDPATDSLNPMAADLGFEDPVESARETAADLREAGVDRLVVLSHLGAGDDEIAAAIDADAVLGGHVHSQRHDYVGDTLLVRPGVNGRRVVEVDLGGDRATATFHEREGAPVHEGLRDALARRMAEAGLDEPIGRVDEPMRRADAVVHGGECRVGNFVADAFRWAHDADVGLSNGGGLRSGDPWHGEVTVADAISLIPFEEPVVRVEVTGAELRAILREMAAPDVDFGEDDWWHGHVSGARVVWDADAAALVEATVGGEPIDPDATYTVATSEYLLHSDHEFPTLAERHRAGESGIQHEVLCEYARETGIDPAIEGRIRIVGGEGDAPGDAAGAAGGGSPADAE